MLPFITDAPSAVQFTMLLLCGIIGLSHLLRPEIWTRFFTLLAAHGTSGVVVHSLMSVSAVIIIVPFHNVWSGPAVAVTLWGWLMLAKVLLGLVVSPATAVRSLHLSERGDTGFRIAGIVMLVVAGCAGWALAREWAPIVARAG
jgi:hypothetical protein